MSADAVKRREQASKQITRLLGLAKQSVAESVEELNVCLDQLEDSYKEYLAAQENVLDFTGDAAYSFETNHSIPVNTAYQEAKVKLLFRIESCGKEGSEQICQH